jgi:hypothetical protein
VSQFLSWCGLHSSAQVLREEASLHGRQLGDAQLAAALVGRRRPGALLLLLLLLLLPGCRGAACCMRRARSWGRSSCF